MTGTADRMGNETTDSLLFNRQIERGGPVARRYQPDRPTRRRLNGLNHRHNIYILCLWFERRVITAAIVPCRRQIATAVTASETEWPRGARESRLYVCIFEKYFQIGAPRCTRANPGEQTGRLLAW